MIRKLILIVLILFIPTFTATANPLIYHTLDGSRPPYESTPQAQGIMFSEKTPLLTLDFIDYGVSDSILLQCGGEVMLVDGAVAWKFPRIANVLRELEITHFTYLFNTHAHNDHIDGLIKILSCDEYTVDAYISCYTDDYQGSAEYTKVRGLFAEKDIPYIRVVNGDHFTLGSAAISVYRDETPGIDKNRHSLVLKVVFGDRSALLMADAGALTQKYFLELYDPSEFKADVLKYAHHGYTSMEHAFVLAVSPELSIITNSRGTANKAEKQLAKLHIPRYYTSQGVVRMQTDGKLWHAHQLPFEWPYPADDQ